MNRIFVDTGAWFARFVPGDADHPAAREWFEQNRDPLITTDYVIDELLTVLKIRGEFQRALELGGSMLDGDMCDVEWVTETDVNDAWQVFSTYRDKEWSFTGCVSRVIMERLRITTAVAFDEHFRQFGTVAVVP
jgi:predicted nucleic acid-binding protein